MYTTDEQTDGQKQRLLPLSYGWGITMCDDVLNNQKQKINEKEYKNRQQK